MKRFFMLTFAISLTVSALADDPVVDAKKIQARITRERDALVKTEVDRRGILGTLYSINKEIKKKESDIESLHGQIHAVQRNIDSYVAIIKKLQVTLDKEKINLRDRLRALAKFGYQGYAQVLLSSKSSADFSRNMKFLKIITEKDRILVENFKTNLDMLARQRDTLHEQVRTYVTFDKQLKSEQKDLLEQRGRQMAIIHRIENEKETHLAALRELHEAGLKLEAQMATLGQQSSFKDVFQQAFFEQKGVLKAPIQAPVTQGYGMIHNARFQTEVFHKGLFFAANEGEPVTAVFNGVVAFAGWLDGYGETVIVDHGEHYYSLYAHNRKILKALGERTITGEKIAEAGDTGSLRGPGLYFEVRHFSETLDPGGWLDLPRAKVTNRTLF